MGNNQSSGSGNRYIGVVKFFDNKKGFGFIASNNCGMPRLMYSQDFYMDRSSFCGEFVPTDGDIVVFDYITQRKGDPKAIKLRKFDPNIEDDIKLGLTYYGEHEIVTNVEKFNLFNAMHIEVARIIPKVIEQLEKTASQEDSVEIFKKFVGRYRAKSSAGTRYIFDRATEQPEKGQWCQLASRLSEVATVLILNSFPSFIRFVNQDVIVPLWLNTLSLKFKIVNDFYIADDLLEISKNLSDSIKGRILDAIHSAADSEIQDYLDSLSKGTACDACHFNNIKKLIKYASHDFDSEIDACKVQIADNHFKGTLDTFSKNANNSFVSLVNEYKCLKNKEIFKPLVSDAIILFVENLFQNGQYQDALGKLVKIYEVLPDSVISIVDNWKSSFSNNLTSALSECIADVGSIIRNFKQLLDSYFSLCKMSPSIENKIGELVTTGAENAISYILEFYSEKDVIPKQYFSSVDVIQENVALFTNYTSKDFSAEIECCYAKVAVNKFLKDIERFKATPGYVFDSLIKSYSSLKDKDTYTDALTSTLTAYFESYIQGEDNKTTSGLKCILFRIKSLEELCPNYYDQLKSDFCNKLKNAILELFSGELSSQSTFNSDFDDLYASFETVYDEDASFKAECRNAILNNQYIDVVIQSIDSSYQWISRNEAINQVTTIINRWDVHHIEDYVCGFTNTLNDIDRVISVSIVKRYLSLITGKRLNEPFDGSSIEEYQQQYYVEPTEHNIEKLGVIQQFVISQDSRTLWESYLSTLAPEDLLSLFQAKVISSLPVGIVLDILTSLTLKDTFVTPSRWYSAPSFQRALYKEIFSNKEMNIARIVSQYLQKVKVTKDNTPLIAWIVELMAANREENPDWRNKKAWEENLTTQIFNLKAQTPNNSRLHVLLCAVYFKTSWTRAALAEVFPWLPPYLQIRVVKRIFKLMAEGKMHHTAASLYSFMTSSGKTLSLPVEILFSYLRLRESDPTETFTNNHMLSLIDGREDHPEWIGIREFVEQCHGRIWVDHDLENNRNTWRSSFYNGIAEMSQDNSSIRLLIANKMIDEGRTLQEYNNKYFKTLQDVISVNFNANEYSVSTDRNGILYEFKRENQLELMYIIRHFNIKNPWFRNDGLNFTIKESDEDYFCDCRLANNLSHKEGLPFYWCANKPCFRPMVRFHTSEEWERYTILDFMRVLNIPTDHTNRTGKTTKHGYFIMLSAYLKSFAKFYKHLKCHECEKLLHPVNVTNYANRAINEFTCTNENCSQRGMTVYLNNCFNKPKCTAVIDSRESKKCPNGQYICPECGGCCSTENYRQKISNLHFVGGYVSPSLKRFVNNNMGHWEKNEFYCYACGNKMEFVEGKWVCPSCKDSVSKSV